MPHYIQSHHYSQITVSAQATLHQVPSPFLNYSFSLGHITYSPIFIPKLQFQLRPHYIQSHLYSQITVSAQVTLHPVPSSFPNYRFSSGYIISSPIFNTKLQFQLRPHYTLSHLHSQTTDSSRSTLLPVPSSFPNYSLSSGHITSSPIFIPKLQFCLRPHYIQSHLHSQITVSAQATLHPVPSPFPNYSFSSGHITSSPIFIPKLKFQLRPHYIQSHLHSQITVSAQATLLPFPRTAL